MRATLSGGELSAAAVQPTNLVEGPVSISVDVDVSNAAVQEDLRQRAEQQLCAGRGASCRVVVASAALNGRRLQSSPSGTLMLTLCRAPC